MRRRLLDPLHGQLRQGATPARLAWSLSVGAALGTFPALGSSTLLCAGAGLLFRLNHVALQVANYLVYPLQLVLLLPLLGAGGRLLGAPVPASLDELKAAVAAGALAAVRRFALATLGAAVVWALLAVPVAVGLALALRPLLARLLPPAAGPPPGGAGPP